MYKNNSIANNNYNYDRYLRNSNTSGYTGIGLNQIRNMRRYDPPSNEPVKAHMAGGGLFGYK